MRIFGEASSSREKLSTAAEIDSIPPAPPKPNRRPSHTLRGNFGNSGNNNNNDNNDISSSATAGNGDRIIVLRSASLANDSSETVNEDSALRRRQSSDSSHSSAESECDDPNMSLLGPAIRIHRYDIGIRLLQFFAFFWLLAGCSFTICVFLCSFVSIGYVTFRSNGTVFVVICAFTFFSFYLFKMLRALLRTFIRVTMAVWREKFGAGSKDMIILRWVDNCAELLCRRRSSSSSSETGLGSGSGSRLSSEQVEMRVEYTKTAILFFILLLCIGVPLIIVATLYGYWAIISVLCALLTLGSALVITLVNIFSRLVRATQFCITIWKNSVKNTDVNSTIMYRLKAAYVASSGNDHSKNTLNVFLEKTIGILVVLVICSFVFSGFKVNAYVLILISCIFVVVLALRFRKELKWLFCCTPCRHKKVEDSFSDHQSETYQVPLPTGAIEEGSGGESSLSTPVAPTLSSSTATLFRDAVNHLDSNDGYYDGKAWLEVGIIFTLRFILIFFGFCCLIYLDMNEVRSVDGKKPIELNLNDSAAQQLIWFSFGFFCTLILKEISFFAPFLNDKVRACLLMTFQVAMLVIGVCGNVFLTGFTFTCATLIAVSEMDFRDGRHFWQNTVKKMKHTKNQKRAMRNAFMILTMIVISLLVSVFVGMAVGIFTTPEVTSDLTKVWSRALIAISKAPVRIAAPICSTKYTMEQISIIELGTMSAAAYQFTAENALAVIHENPKLKYWTVGLYSLDNSNVRPVLAYQPNATVVNLNITSGVRFVEFVSPLNVSVVAIRGTFKLEDLFQDLYMWSTVALLQLSSYFGTFVNAWPVETVAWVNYFITRLAAYPNLMYYEEMEMIVSQIIEYKTRRIGIFNSKPTASLERVMVTGHSLGGGLASIVASHLGIEAATFSAPGLGYSTINYNISQESIMQLTVNVIPMQDPVAAFDKQIGLVQNVKCDAGMPMGCHSIERTIQTLTEMCAPENLKALSAASVLVLFLACLIVRCPLSKKIEE